MALGFILYRVVTCLVLKDSHTSRRPFAKKNDRPFQQDREEYAIRDAHTKLPFLPPTSKELRRTMIFKVTRSPNRRIDL
jgi:hypothetical protein